MNKLTVDTLQLNGVTFEVLLTSVKSHSEKRGHSLDCVIEKKANKPFPKLPDLVEFFEANPAGELSVEFSPTPVTMYLLNFDIDAVTESATFNLSKEATNEPPRNNTKR
jgi:hypothetical protein